jgi:DNA-binding MarR family transcriptional regulator
MEGRFETFTGLMTSINRSIRRIKTEEMLGFNLKSQHVSCLYYLYKEASLIAKDLCELCEEDKANVSRSIEYLEANGYLVSNSQTRKRYRTPLALTEKGKEVAAYIAKKIDEVILSASEGVSEEHRTIMYDSLMTICQNLQTICNQYEE